MQKYEVFGASLVVGWIGLLFWYLEIEPETIILFAGRRFGSFIVG
jgi:hypothetical protein